ncbi:EF-hand domain-containing protein [Prochlorothrix hollandica]|uniref:EF-hand domain-containing protein n=1 Tax=Prochlorothrix hollandica TaxID=1223 RepID=UPI0009D983FB
MQSQCIQGPNNPNPRSIALIQQLFAAADLDGNGTLDLDEVHTIFDRADLNSDGKIDFEEFRRHIEGL